MVTFDGIAKLSASNMGPFELNPVSNLFISTMDSVVPDPMKLGENLGLGQG